MASTRRIDDCLSNIQHTLEGIIEDASSLLSRVEGLNAEEADSWLADKIINLGQELSRRGGDLASDGYELTTAVDDYADELAAEEEEEEEEERFCAVCHLTFGLSCDEHDDTDICENCVG